MADAALSALFDSAQGSTIRKCLVCDGILVPKRGRSKYCSRACSRVVEYEAIKARKGIKSPGDMLVCERCDNPYEWRGPKTKYCKPCVHERAKEKSEAYRRRNPELTRQRQKKIDDARRGTPKRVELSRRKGREMTEKRRNNPRLRLDHRMGVQIQIALRDKKGGRAWESLVGYTLDDLMRHLERQFLPGMSWDNIGDWHVDHRVPKKAHNYESEDDPDFKACWALTNLQPLWARENISKGASRTLLL